MDRSGTIRFDEELERCCSLIRDFVVESSAEMRWIMEFSSFEWARFDWGELDFETIDRDKFRKWIYGEFSSSFYSRRGANLVKFFIVRII